MKRGILFAALIALIGSASVSCRRATDPQRIAAVDSLIHALEAVRLTLNELDTTHYATADSLLQADRSVYLRRFADTLDRAHAAALGGQFVQLREATRRATDHRNVMQAIDKGAVRLKQLRTDLVNAALTEAQCAEAIRREAIAVETIEYSTLQVINAYQTNQEVLQQRPIIDSLLTDTLPERRKR